MILNQRLNNFILLFPIDFYTETIKERYRAFHKQMLLPYDTLEDFMSSTVHAINFPGWNMDMVRQIRMHGAEQDFKNAKPIKDLQPRKFQVDFKLTDAFLNYFIFYDNSLAYLDFDNKQQYFDGFRIVLLNNEGYPVVFLDLHKVILTGMSDYKMAYSKGEPLFNTFSANFTYNDWDLSLNHDMVGPIG